MQQAVNFINQNTTRTRYRGRVITPTHYYVKFTPQNEDDLLKLDSLDKRDDLVLFNFPLDYEIIEEGNYLERSDAREIKYSPVYTTIPVNFSLPPGLSYEILAEVYKPTPGEWDLEVAAYVLSGNSADLDISYHGEPLNIDNLAGFLNESYNNRMNLGYRPYGWFKVYDTETADYVGVKYTKIAIGNAIFWRYTYTDDNGYFESPVNFVVPVRIRAKWRSSLGVIRRSANELLGIGVSDFLMKEKKNNNGRIYFTEHCDKHKWPKATVNNALVKYNSFISSVHVPFGVRRANIWVINAKNSPSGATPMFHLYTPHLTFFEAMILYYFGYSAILWMDIVNELISYLYPDLIFMIVPCENTTKEIDQLVFHEAGHFSHAIKAGNNFWNQFVASETSNMLHHGGDPYSDGDDPTPAKGRLIALCEGWATFTEHAVMYHYYTTDYNGYNIYVAIDTFDMYVVPDSHTRPYDSWFLTGLIWDVMDNHSKGEGDLINNNVYPSTSDPIIDSLYLGDISTDFSPVYNCLTPAIRDGYRLRKCLNSHFLTYSSQINQLFDSYGY